MSVKTNVNTKEHPVCTNCKTILTVRARFKGKTSLWWCKVCEKNVTNCETKGEFRTFDKTKALHTNSIRSKSGFKGVYLDKRSGRFRSIIGFKKKNYYLGSFIHAEEAAIAYNLKATELYGASAFQNDINQHRDPKDYEYGTKGFNPYV